MKIVYFAWLRERIGMNEEIVELPSEVGTVDEFLNWMAGRGETYEAALQDPDVVRVALDQKHATSREASLNGVSEIAMFPPMTGG